MSSRARGEAAALGQYGTPFPPEHSGMGEKDRNQLQSPVNLWHSKRTQRHVAGDAAARRQRLKASYAELLIPFSLKTVVKGHSSIFRPSLT